MCEFCPWWDSDKACGKPSRSGGELCEDHYAALNRKHGPAEPERSDERVAEVKCVQDSAMCDGAVRLVPYCEEHDPRKGSR